MRRPPRSTLVMRLGSHPLSASTLSQCHGPPLLTVTLRNGSQRTPCGRHRTRSEERRVGEECRGQSASCPYTKKEDGAGCGGSAKVPRSERRAGPGGERRVAREEQ